RGHRGDHDRPHGSVAARADSGLFRARVLHAASRRALPVATEAGRRAYDCAAGARTPYRRRRTRLIIAAGTPRQQALSLPVFQRGASASAPPFRPPPQRRHETFGDCFPREPPPINRGPNGFRGSSACAGGNAVPSPLQTLITENAAAGIL